MRSVHLYAFGSRLPPIRDGVLESGVAYSVTVRVRMLVSTIKGVDKMENAPSAITMAVFECRGNDEEYVVYELVNGPPSGWMWVIYNGKIHAAHAETFYQHRRS